MILGDPFSAKSVIGTLLIVLGAVLIAIFGVVPSQHHSLEDLVALYKNGAFIVYFSLLNATALALLGVITWQKRILKRLQRGTLSELETPLKLPAYQLQTLIGIIYGCVSGMISAESLMFAKSGIELLWLTVFDGRNQFDKPLSWLILIALATTALGSYTFSTRDCVFATRFFLSRSPFAATMYFV